MVASLTKSLITLAFLLQSAKGASRAAYFPSFPMSGDDVSDDIKGIAMEGSQHFRNDEELDFGQTTTFAPPAAVGEKEVSNFFEQAQGGQSRLSIQTDVEERNMDGMCDKIECNTVLANFSQAILVNRCDDIQLEKRCSNCTWICYGIASDHECSGDWNDCMPKPTCEKVCDESSCIQIEIPLCSLVEEQALNHIPVHECKLVRVLC